MLTSSPMHSAMGNVCIRTPKAVTDEIKRLYHRQKSSLCPLSLETRLILFSRQEDGPSTRVLHGEAIGATKVGKCQPPYGYIHLNLSGRNGRVALVSRRGAVVFAGSLMALLRCSALEGRPHSEPLGLNRLQQGTSNRRFAPRWPSTAHHRMPYHIQRQFQTQYAHLATAATTLGPCCLHYARRAPSSLDAHPLSCGRASSTYVLH
jgi:hypothetical protein